MYRPTLSSLLLIAGPLLAQSLQAQDYAEGAAPIIIDGKVTDGTNKLPDSEVVVYKGNEVVSTLPTGKSGRFKAELKVGEVYSIEFRHAGFVPKRIVFDTHMPKPKKDHDFEIEPIPMDISLLEHARFEGANTDDLDFPFAMVKFNKKTLAFEQDVEYTMGMQRTNGALLLMAARSGMNK